VLVWASLRWFGIEFSDFRMGREKKQSTQDKTELHIVQGNIKQSLKKEKEQIITEKMNASSSGSGESQPWLRKTWRERSIWRDKQTKTAEEGADQA
jgi:hypothetical protein